MSAYRVIDKMETLVREGVWLPFGWRAVHAEMVLDLIEKLRSTLPEDGRISSTAPQHKKAGENLEAVQARSGSAMPAGGPQESDIIARAQARAEAIVSDAQTAARDIRRGADEYADHVLAALDASLGKALAAVQKGRQQLATSVAANGKKSPEMSSL